MTVWLKRSTAVNVLIGPFIDDTDGKTAETGVAITDSNTFLSKNGAAQAVKHETTHPPHDALGYYICSLDTTDTDTLGVLKLMVHIAGALPVWESFMVVAADAWDSLFGAVVVGQAGAQAALVANNLDHLVKTATAAVDMTTEVADGTIISRIISNSDTSLYVPATSNLTTIGAVTIDVHDTDLPAVKTDTAAIPTAGAGTYTVTITVHDSGGVDIAGASVWISTDVGGSTVIASGTTSDTGTLTLYLDAATYYLWAQLAGFNFSNPATLVVTTSGATATVTSSTPVGLGSGSVSTVMTIHDSGGADLAGAHVWVSSDVGGATIVASGTTGVDGTVTFMLDPGTYYCWVQLSSYSFTNPTTLTVS